MRRLLGRRRVLIAVIVAVIVVGFLVIRRTQLAETSARNQGRFFYGLRDVGLGLRGELVTAPVTDWSFTDKFFAVQIQTRPWHRIPYTIVVCIGQVNGAVYFLSDYLAPPPGATDYRGRFPEARAWNRTLLNDPRMRVKIGDRLFDGMAYPVTDVAEIEMARAFFINKYVPFRKQQEGPEAMRPRMYIFRFIQKTGIEPILQAHAQADRGLRLADEQVARGFAAPNLSR